MERQGRGGGRGGSMSKVTGKRSDGKGERTESGRGAGTAVKETVRKAVATVQTGGAKTRNKSGARARRAGAKRNGADKNYQKIRACSVGPGGDELASRKQAPSRVRSATCISCLRRGCSWAHDTAQRREILLSCTRRHVDCVFILGWSHVVICERFPANRWRCCGTRLSPRDTLRFCAVAGTHHRAV